MGEPGSKPLMRKMSAWEAVSPSYSGKGVVQVEDDEGSGCDVGDVGVDSGGGWLVMAGGSGG